MTRPRTVISVGALTLALTTLIAFPLSHRAAAQEPATVTTPITRYVPDDALATMILSPSSWFENPMIEMFPIEILRVQMSEQFGIDPFDIDEVKMVVALDPQTMQPLVGVVISLSAAPDYALLREAIDAAADPVQIDGHEAYVIDGPPGSVISQIDEQTLFVGTANYMRPMLNAENGTGELPSLLQTMTHQSGLTIAMVTEQVRPILSGVAMQGAGNLAPDLQPLAQIPGLTDAIKVHVDFGEGSGALRLALVGTDEVAAQRIESILIDSIVAARVLAIAEINRSLANSDQSQAMREATDRYANRMADMITKNLKPTLRGDEVAIEVESSVSVATTGVLVGLLLPAVQAARQAARRMSSSNNIKQIMLAMHNYHSAYRQLPKSAITDDDGKPLLSWRVAILPFIEEQALYQKFHLDEPWDSEHNLPLAKELPAVYQSPGVTLGPGMTVMQAVVGEDMGMRPLEKTAFRDFLDGLSNSALILEVNAEAAVIWSKPEDIEIDKANPLQHLGKLREGGFHIGMADGAVRFFTNSTGPEFFLRLLTRAGKETIDHDQW
ncbi:DUF1559 domain-containing protein [Aporhodopirellula aestuarii]|uniref:DUF1559 domain-containing protein n=1 Tax=Aporhodopirellula aestuarii TaxID=2950107 RepID=A0ABT0U1X5_9BACT|nr:DUF1559 domain-containing protein [Aporhodopirellula aestuarii]MCM2370893.1 DUF1559 domain-containing protein [Aporhodopirellula aestuarii]